MSAPRVIWLAGYISTRKGIIPPERITYLPDANGNPPVPRAVIPRQGGELSSSGVRNISFDFPEHAQIERVSKVRPVLFEPSNVRATHDSVGMRYGQSAGDGRRVLRKGFGEPEREGASESEPPSGSRFRASGNRRFPSLRSRLPSPLKGIRDVARVR